MDPSTNIALQPIDPAVMQTLSVVAFSTGGTALVKKLGVQGNWLVLVCFLFGGLSTVMTVHTPELWSALSALIVSTQATGNVALIGDLLAKFKRQ